MEDSVAALDALSPFLSWEWYCRIKDFWFKSVNKIEEEPFIALVYKDSKFSNIVFKVEAEELSIFSMKGSIMLAVALKLGDGFQLL